MPETGEAIEDRRRDRRGQHEVRPQQRQNPDRPGGKIGDAEFANQRQGVVAMDVENLLGGEPGVETLPLAGERNANAGPPEHEPLADERHQRRGGVEQRMLNHDRAEGSSQAKDGEIDLLLPAFYGASGAPHDRQARSETKAMSRVDRNALARLKAKDRITSDLCAVSLGYSLKLHVEDKTAVMPLRAKVRR